MGLLLALLTFSLIMAAPLSASLPDDKTYVNSSSPDINPHMNSTAQLIALNPFYQCDIYPRVCRQRDGLNPDCCKKKCVNVDSDYQNCGSCGRKCKSGEACCKRKCVNVLTSRSNCGICGMKCKYNESCCNGKCKNIYSDKRNCGACHNKCKRGESCAFGMCNYA